MFNHKAPNSFSIKSCSFLPHALPFHYVRLIIQPDAREASSQSPSDAEEVLPHMAQATTTGPDNGKHDSGCDSDHADALVRQLESPSDDSDDESSADAGGGGVSINATHRIRGAVWISLRYATFITGVHKFVHEKHRVQSYLSKELAKAEKEVDEEDGETEAPERRFTDDVRATRARLRFTSTSVPRASCYYCNNKVLI